MPANHKKREGIIFHLGNNVKKRIKVQFKLQYNKKHNNKKEMSQRKMWDQNQDNMIKKIVQQNNIRKQNQKWKWSQIAQILQTKIFGCIRTGKQCRQRWYNHLDPTITKNKQLTKQQIYKLFQLQNKLGNKWSIIAKQFYGRTDSTLKNFFYSSLRRAIRQINLYICHHKKKTNIKQFKQVILSKILKINDQKYQQKLNIKTQKVKQLAKNIKQMLAQLSLEDQNQQLSSHDIQFRDQLIQSIQQFNKNCKKKKQKKILISEQQYLNDSSDLLYNYHDPSQQSSTILKQSNHKMPIIKKQQIKNEQQHQNPIQKTQKTQKKPKAKTITTTNTHQLQPIKKQQQQQYQPYKQLFSNPLLDKKKSQIQQLQQANPIYKWPSQNKMVSISGDLFKKSSYLWGQFQPLKMLTKKSSYQDNRSHGFISNLQNWKKAQSKSQNGLFASYGTHDLIQPSLLESINLGQSLPKIYQNSTNQSGFLKLLKTDSKTQQGNANN